MPVTPHAVHQRCMLLAVHGFLARACLLAPQLAFQLALWPEPTCQGTWFALMPFWGREKGKERARSAKDASSAHCQTPACACICAHSPLTTPSPASGHQACPFLPCPALPWQSRVVDGRSAGRGVRACCDLRVRRARLHGCAHPSRSPAAALATQREQSAISLHSQGPNHLCSIKQGC